MSVATFWEEHVLAGPFADAVESFEALRERERLYPDLRRLMPVDLPGRVVLDYGCGPGHDTVMTLLSGARRVYYADASVSALQVTMSRLALHELDGGVAVLVADEGEPQLPLGIEHAHCAGVLHHVSDPLAVLSGIRKVLPLGCELRLMVYDGDRSRHTQSEVPITHWWSERELKALAREAEFDARYVGGYECSSPWRPECVAACYVLR